MTRFINGLIMEDNKIPMLTMFYGGDEYNVANNQHIGVISGKRGSGKTTLIVDLINACLTGEVQGVFKFNCDNKKVVHIDTEQPDDLLYKFKERVSKEGEYICHSLSHLFSAREKWEEVVEIINREKEACVFIIDVLSDLADDPNDFKQASRISQSFQGLAKNKDALIIIVAHNNAEDTILGAVGKYVENKSAFSFNISMDNTTGVSRVKNVKYRLEDLPDFSFTVTEDKKVELGVYIPFP